MTFKYYGLTFTVFGDQLNEPEEEMIETEQVIDDNLIMESEVIEEAVLSDIEHDALPNQLLESEETPPTDNQDSPATESVIEAGESSSMDEGSGDAEKKSEDDEEAELAQQSAVVSDRRGKLPIWKLKMMEQQAAAKVQHSF